MHAAMVKGSIILQHHLSHHLSTALRCFFSSVTSEGVGSWVMIVMIAAAIAVGQYKKNDGEFDEIVMRPECPRFVYMYIIRKGTPCRLSNVGGGRLKRPDIEKACRPGAAFRYRSNHLDAQELVGKAHH